MGIEEDTCTKTLLFTNFLSRIHGTGPPHSARDRVPLWEES